MATIGQLLRGARKGPPRRKCKFRQLDGSPFKKGICLRVYTMTPKKPNSANRKVCKVQLTNGFKALAYIPGAIKARGQRANLPTDYVSRHSSTWLP